MREPHPVFDRNIEANAPVWRYFDFAKFTAMLQRSALYFSRADLLGDPLEGSFTRAYAAERDEMIKNPPLGRTSQEQEAIFQHNERIFSATPRQIYVNCWHLGDHESMAMWRGYGAGPYGIAIRATFSQLDSTIPLTVDITGLNTEIPGALGEHFKKEPIRLGRVQYVDYASLTERLPHEFSIYGRLMCKSLAYRHENELRAIFAAPIVVRSTHGDAPDQATRVDGAPGIEVQVDLNNLVSSVVVSPLSPSWFVDVVRHACEKYSLKAPIETSIVAITPIH